jgi:hypothetical protein
MYAGGLTRQAQLGGHNEKEVATFGLRRPLFFAARMSLLPSVEAGPHDIHINKGYFFKYSHLGISDRM